MEEQNRRRVSVFEDDEIPYEVRMKHLIKSYRKDLKREGCDKCLWQHYELNDFDGLKHKNR